MIYSVWDHSERRYDYYRTPEKSAEEHAPKPKHVKDHAMGATPTEAAWPLPGNARLVGHGKYPKGQIATRSRGGLGLGALDIDSGFIKIALLSTAGLLLWREMNK